MAVKAKKKDLRFEVAQEIGLSGEVDGIGLQQPKTGADALTKTDYGNKQLKTQ